jgi:CheY-like chemotaxis protein
MQHDFDVMVVDDDVDIRDALQSLFEDEGLSVVLAACREEARQLLQRIRPRVILLDMFMPGMTSEQFLASLQATAALSSVPVVFMTASKPPDGTIAKPFLNVQSLVDRVREAMADGIAGPQSQVCEAG